MAGAKIVRFCVLLCVLCCTGAVVAGDRSTADAYLTSVPKSIADGDFKTAENLCTRALEADPTCPSAHFYRAACYEKNNKAKDAYKEYQLAVANATKDKDPVLAAKAATAAKKLGAGLGALDELDTKLAGKLQTLATDALEAGQLETAKQAFSALIALQPDNAKAKEGLDKATKALEEKGDPVRAKVAQAMLSEMWYSLGSGKKDDATELAKRLSNQFKDTEWGKEAAGLLDRDFAAPAKNEVADLAKKLKEQAAKKPAKTAPATVSTTATNVPGTGSTGAKSPSAAAHPGVDVEALEKAADVETAKMPKTGLVPAFIAAHDKGKDFYTKATPGSEGNQENVKSALEQFIRCASLYERIDAEKLSTEELAQREKNASMLRYACMKMTILSH